MTNIINIRLTTHLVISRCHIFINNVQPTTEKNMSQVSLYCSLNTDYIFFSIQPTICLYPCSDGFRQDWLYWKKGSVIRLIVLLKLTLPKGNAEPIHCCLPSHLLFSIFTVEMLVLVMINDAALTSYFANFCLYINKTCFTLMALYLLTVWSTLKHVFQSDSIFEIWYWCYAKFYLQLKICHKMKYKTLPIFK